MTQKIMELWAGREQFQVFAGVNLPFVIETILSGSMPSRENMEDMRGTLKGTDGVGEWTAGACLNRQALRYV